MVNKCSMVNGPLGRRTLATNGTQECSMAKSFGRSELAQQYFPKLSAMSAWRKFREWLDYNPRLRSLLSLSRRTYTPADLFPNKCLPQMLIETLAIHQESLFCKPKICAFSASQLIDYQYFTN